MDCLYKGLRLLVLLIGTWSIGAGHDVCAEQPPVKLPPGARVAVTASQAVRALTTTATLGEEKLSSNAEISRGPGVSVYPKVAPATVLVHTPNCFGTGFVIGEDGWIVTNCHVVDKASIRISTGVRVAKIYLGHLSGRIMEVDEQGIIADIYKINEEKDLALLKLMALPEGVEKLPVVPFAEEVPPAGSDCVVIGHPRAGMLWTLRSGEIAGVGFWPQDMLKAVKMRLMASKQDAEQLAKTIAAGPKQKILITSCGINPGDSGGPLVDAEGKLIGVSFAIPRSQRGEGISLDKFSYHVHLDEVKKFIHDRPQQAPLYVPGPWPIAMFSTLMDSDGDQKADMWMFAMRPDQPMTGCLFDRVESP